MTSADLSSVIGTNIACLNEQDWSRLGQFVHEEVFHNGEQIGLAGYQEMLERDFRKIPDLFFDVRMLVCEPPRLASRLRFDCTPIGILFGYDVNGRKVSFTENVFYEFQREQITSAWSVIDKAAMAAAVEQMDDLRDH